MSKKQRVNNRNSRNSNRDLIESAVRNRFDWMMYRDKLCELAISMFEWKGLPPEIDPIFMERALFFEGKILFFKEDGINQYVVMRFNGGGTFNIYNIPQEREAFASNTYHVKKSADDSIIIYNNMLRTPSVLDMEIFSRKLEQVDRTIEINLNAQKTPVMILCDEKQRLTMKNLYMKYDGNEPFIFGDKAQLNPKSIQALNTNAPFIAAELYGIKSRIWNEALTYLGISNINYQKKERMIQDEVTRNMGGTIANRYSRLEARREACRQINQMFGLNVWCDFREDYQDIEKGMDTIAGEPDSDGEGGTEEATKGGEPDE